MDSEEFTCCCRSVHGCSTRDGRGSAAVGIPVSGKDNRGALRRDYRTPATRAAQGARHVPRPEVVPDLLQSPRHIGAQLAVLRLRRLGLPVQHGQPYGDVHQSSQRSLAG